MNWEVVNGFTGIVSATCAFVSLLYLGFEQRRATSTESHATLSMHSFMSLILATSGWALLCLSGFWIFEPFGCCPLDQEYLKLYGVILAFPAGVLFLAGMKLMNPNSET
ncbi:hypothetical protein soil367_05095 [Hydrocarboniclastica marina]|uniref:Uncharacterized protein n=1 Tax=Hydrocarboniclastica marina TaxID=2259620 RepID=A0A4P7XEQ4_9ALTE|nr:hypothetical protein soil367_05095 [Hydrocarboniclastica marina]